jgi:hypothetical protein
MYTKKQIKIKKKNFQFYKLKILEKTNGSLERLFFLSYFL